MRRLQIRDVRHPLLRVHPLLVVGVELCGLLLLLLDVGVACERAGPAHEPPADPNGDIPVRGDVQCLA
ncbi:hypothetical protein BJX66DRAFT_320975 [Aspergillus keveii]|uniref:Secreted protein n=1 Tax=Aspergillus keveii TaxID=714993 RepID=A0ABR4FGG4_9EURO